MFVDFESLRGKVGILLSNQLPWFLESIYLDPQHWSHSIESQDFIQTATALAKIYEEAIERKISLPIFLETFLIKMRDIISYGNLFT